MELSGKNERGEVELHLHMGRPMEGEEPAVPLHLHVDLPALPSRKEVN